MEIQGPRVAKMILKKNKVRELTEPDFTYLTYYKAMINKTVWCFGKRIDKQTSQTQSRVKRQTTELKKIFLISIIDKKPRISEKTNIHKEKDITQFLKGGREGKYRHLTKENIQIVNKQMKCTTSVVIREMQIKNTKRHHFIYTRVIFFQNNYTKCW